MAAPDLPSLLLSLIDTLHFPSGFSFSFPFPSSSLDPVYPEVQSGLSGYFQSFFLGSRLEVLSNSFQPIQLYAHSHTYPAVHLLENIGPAHRTSNPTCVVEFTLIHSFHLASFFLVATAFQPEATATNFTIIA
jgi:hypothetical protein